MYMTYLGDSVYISYDGCGIVLSTKNSYNGITQEIYLDLNVYEKLQQYITHVKEMRNQLYASSDR